MLAQLVRIDYTNWQGVRRWRTVLPVAISFEATEWQPEPQWLLEAVDQETNTTKKFSLREVHEWRSVS